MRRGDVACGAKDVEDWGAEMGETGCGVVALGAVEGEDGGSVWIEVVIGGVRRMSDEFADWVDGRPKGTDKSEDLLVLGCGKTDRGLRFVVLRRRRSRDVTQAVADEEIKHTRIPGLVERLRAERGGGGGAGRPDFAAGGAEGSRSAVRLGRAGELLGGGEAGDDGVEHDDAGEEARVHEGDVCEGVCAKGVAHGDDGARHAEGVDDVEGVAGVIEPVGVIAQVGRIEDAALALVSGISDPDGTQTKTLLLQFFQEILIERLIEFLWKAICMSAHDGDVAFARRPAMSGSVLLYAEQKRLVLRDCGCARVFPDVGCLDGVLADVEDGG